MFQGVQANVQPNVQPNVQHKAFQVLTQDIAGASQGTPAAVNIGYPPDAFDKPAKKKGGFLKGLLIALGVAVVAGAGLVVAKNKNLLKSVEPLIEAGGFDKFKNAVQRGLYNAAEALDTHVWQKIVNIIPKAAA
jgi:hypothetical protein